MRTEEKYMFGLLGELSDICRKKKAVFFIIGNELLFSYIGKRTPSCSADICMTLKDFKLIEKELQEKKDRYLENIYNNPDMPGMYFRYVNTKTLMIQPEYHKVRKAHGIDVNIHIIREKNIFAEELSDYENVLSSNIESNVCNKDFFASAVINEKKRDNIFAKWIDELLKKSALTDFKADSVLYLPKIGNITLPSGFWNDTYIVSIEGRKFTVPTNAEVILKQCYGEDFAQKIYRPCNENFRMIVVPNISYLDFDDDYWDEFKFDGDFWNKRSGFLEFFYKKWLHSNIELRKNQNHLYFQRSRFWLWKRYYKSKSRIRELFVTERYDELKLIFQNFEDHIMMHKLYDQIPFFDREIWEIYLQVLKEQGEIEKAKDLIEIFEANPVCELDNTEIEKYYQDFNPMELLSVRKLL